MTNWLTGRSDLMITTPFGRIAGEVDVPSSQKSHKKPPHDLSEKCAALLQWTPAHCGIAGNKRTDKLA